MSRIVVTMATSEAEADLRDAMKVDPALVGNSGRWCP